MLVMQGAMGGTQQNRFWSDLKILKDKDNLAERWRWRRQTDHVGNAGGILIGTIGRDMVVQCGAKCRACWCSIIMWWAGQERILVGTAWEPCNTGKWGILWADGVIDTYYETTIASAFIHRISYDARVLSV